MIQTVAFAVDCPEDLLFLADFLADQGRSGEDLVRWMVRHGRWPVFDGWAKHGWYYRTHGGDNDDLPLPLRPTGMYVDSDGQATWEWLDTPSEAVWTLIERYEQNPVALPEE